MNYYTAEDKYKSVREVVLDVTNPSPVDSKFGMMMLGSNYHMLRSNVWVTGFFRLDSDPGPYLMLRADGGYCDKLKNQPFRVAHCFYRMKQGGLFAIFIDFPKLKLSGIPSGDYVLFEMIRGIDMDDEKERISDAINRSNLHICFAEGDGPGEEFGGMWSGGSINAEYDVIVELSQECRNELNKEWESLFEYHRSLSAGRRDFNDSIQQMQAENPLTHNPIVDRNKGAEPSGEKITATSSTLSTKSKSWWQFWK
ncbi:hypothetical protein MHK_006675 [Candidatus Magnetomorum sp. HK-1]|nr:hypothetical protein MHK_006675 [Candidatus Magnetomorum sp. HK-1]